MNCQFPPELVQLIVEASLDPYDIFRSCRRACRTRYATLKSYSLLNSTWYGASQAELVKSVKLYTDRTVEAFLELAQRRGGTVEGTRELFVSTTYDGDSSTIPKLLKSTPHLLNLSVHDSTMDFGDLAPLQRLRRLELESMNVTGPQSSSRLCLPQLERLSIQDYRVEDSASHFFTPACLPRLRQIIITDDCDSIAPLIPQLELINAGRYNMEYPPLSRAKSLLLLPLPRYADERFDLLSNLPSLPPFLHIVICSCR